MKRENQILQIKKKRMRRLRRQSPASPKKAAGFLTKALNAPPSAIHTERV